MSNVVLTTPAPVAVGIDVVSIDRIERALARGLLDSVCHPTELSEGPFSAVEAAKIWTAKEAVVKTLGTGFYQGGVDFPDVQVRPEGTVTLHRNAFKAAPNSRFQLLVSELDGAIMTMALRFDDGGSFS